MESGNYKRAYEREKKAREHVEAIIEERTRELYDMNTELQQAYEKLKKQKMQLMHQEKLASLGQLSAGIAHEINNPVGFIQANLGILKDYSDVFNKTVSLYKSLLKDMNQDDTSKYIENLEAIEKNEKESEIDYILEDMQALIDESLGGTTHVISIVDGLKNFARVDDDKKQLLLVNDCISYTIKLLNNEIKHKASLKLDLKEDLPPTKGNPGSINQVILNLIVNACQAIKEIPGQITITSNNDEENIYITVQDNGCGMKEKTISKIFDPFFTTKDVGVGTGLGLSISMGIIEQQHKGKITVESTLGQGTCFTIQLPIVK